MARDYTDVIDVLKKAGAIIIEPIIEVPTDETLEKVL